MTDDDTESDDRSLSEKLAELHKKLDDAAEAVDDVDGSEEIDVGVPSNDDGGSGVPLSEYLSDT